MLMTDEVAALLGSRSFDEINRLFRPELLWDLFDGDRDRLNLSWECLDRHRGEGMAMRLCRPDGYEDLSFDELADWSGRFANFLEDDGIGRGDPVAVMLEPSLPFYAAIFGAIKRGAVAVPLFTLFGPDAVRARIDDCRAKILVVGSDQAAMAEIFGDQLQVLVFDEDLLDELSGRPTIYDSATRGDDLAVLQYTSGTNKAFPEAVPHKQRSVVTLMRAALFGLGLRPGDRYFCPSSPGWGHGLWDGTIAPWALGVTSGAYAGRFDPERLVRALNDLEITNLAAAGTVYRMLRASGAAEKLPSLEKASYTGEALEAETISALGDRLGTPVCGMYGTTETGVLTANYPGTNDYTVFPGALGRALPGLKVAILDDDSRQLDAGQVGEISVWRQGGWLRTRDLGRVDDDAYFWYGGRADDVVISAGWTISPFEVEEAMMAHPDMVEVAVIGVADEVRSQVLKAFVVARRHDDAFVTELQDLVRQRLSQHEYPRVVEFVVELPKTPGGKVNRRELREREASKESARIAARAEATR